jgi:hypothetical protein
MKSKITYLQGFGVLHAKQLLITALVILSGQLNAQSVTGYRYWVNDDPATLANATVAPGASIQLNDLLDLPSLGRNYNLMTIQFVDDNGAYSVPYTQFFVKNTGQVNGYEYWIDDAIEQRTTLSAGPASVLDLITELPTGISAGMHTVTIRFSSANGTWTVPLVASFDYYVGIEELPGITELTLFPNPVSDGLGLRLTAEAARTLNVQVLDPNGRLVRDLSTWSVSGTSYRSWDISDLAEGGYLLRMSDGNGAWTTRFVKQ